VSACSSTSQAPKIFEAQQQGQVREHLGTIGVTVKHGAVEGELVV
jgi:hypothetical protein